MKKAFLFFALLYFFASQPIYGASIYLNPSSMPLPDIGETFEIELCIGDVENFGAMQCYIDFGMLKYLDLELQSEFLASTGRQFKAYVEVDYRTREIKILLSSSGSSPGPTGSGVIATMLFEVEQQEAEEITPFDVRIQDVEGNSIAVDSIGGCSVGIQKPNDDDDDDSTCPLNSLLDNDDSRLGILRKFRNEILAYSPMGRKLIAIYYKNEESITAAFKKYPALRKTTREMVEAIVPAMDVLLK